MRGVTSLLNKYIPAVGQKTIKFVYFCNLHDFGAIALFWSFVCISASVTAVPLLSSVSIVIPNNVTLIDTRAACSGTFPEGCFILHGFFFFFMVL